MSHPPVWRKRPTLRAATSSSGDPGSRKGLDGMDSSACFVSEFFQDVREDVDNPDFFCVGEVSLVTRGVTWAPEPLWRPSRPTSLPRAAPRQLRIRRRVMARQRQAQPVLRARPFQLESMSAIHSIQVSHALSRALFDGRKKQSSSGACLGGLEHSWAGPFHFWPRPPLRPPPDNSPGPS